MTLTRLYQGQTSVVLDEYETPSPYFEHGAFMRVGSIRCVSPTGLSADFWECRLPARFCKAVVTRPGGMAVGTLSTGSGDEAAALVADICRALATGFAQLVGAESEGFRADAPACVVLTEPESAGVVALSSAEPVLIARARAAVAEGLLSFEVAGA